MSLRILFSHNSLLISSHGGDFRQDSLSTIFVVKYLFPNKMWRIGKRLIAIDLTHSKSVTKFFEGAFIIK